MPQMNFREEAQAREPFTFLLLVINSETGSGHSSPPQNSLLIQTFHKLPEIPPQGSILSLERNKTSLILHLFGRPLFLSLAENE